MGSGRHQVEQSLVCQTTPPTIGKHQVDNRARVKMLPTSVLCRRWLTVGGGIRIPAPHLLHLTAVSGFVSFRKWICAAAHSKHL